MKLLLGSFVDERGGSSSSFERSISLSSYGLPYLQLGSGKVSVNTKKIRNIFGSEQFTCFELYEKGRVLVVLIRCYIARFIYITIAFKEWFTANAHKGTHNDVIMRSMDEEKCVLKCCVFN